MKKLICVFSIILVIACLFTMIPAFSADTDFVVENGVLVSYKGNSTSVIIPSSVNSISDEAFMNNKSIKSVALHDKVYSIGNKAFYGCTSLSTVSGGANVTQIGALAFLQTKFLLNSTEEFLCIGSALVCYNGESSSVVLPDSITSISPYAFLRNDKITSFTAGNNLVSICEGAFYECSVLGSVSVTKNVSFIGADAFYGTKWLDSQTGFVTLGDSILVSYKGSATSVAVPSTVLQIAANAFYSNTTVKTLSIPSTVFAVGARAFMNCSNLTDVKFSNGLVMIDDEAFANCTKISSLELPTTLSKVGKGAFLNCTKLEIAYIRGNDLYVDNGAFAYCTFLKTALISDGVTAVGEDAFAYCAKLAYVTVPSQVKTISAGSFNDASLLTVICDDNSFAQSALAGAVKTTNSRGDTDMDSHITVLDATAIQFMLAKLKTLDSKQLAFADADSDAYITVLDATYIQRVVAKLI